jgi:hypothetical protein
MRLFGPVFGPVGRVGGGRTGPRNGPKPGLRTRERGSWAHWAVWAGVGRRGGRIARAHALPSASMEAVIVRRHRRARRGTGVG